MTSKEIRQAFLDFFAGKDHKIVPSAPVVPHGDPTLLFTNAGMNQFKDVFLGIGTRDYKRAADTQKCIRVSGKHNDLEEVGVDTYHHTFFEMLGNWSFGDYYKEEAIDWAWELLTKVWKLDVNRLHATVYRTDDESYDLWKNYLPESRIHRFDEKDNFWEMGETGPCGPCSEIHYDATPDLSGAKLVNAGLPDVIEIWNLVFIQYNRKPGGELEELSAKHVDTGMGFERICAVIQGKESNYDTDIFMPIIQEIENLSGKKYSRSLNDADGIAMRVIADHLRTLSFAIADGALPGNEGRGYVLRRILRRGSRYARNLGFRQPVIYKLLPTLIETMGYQFPELEQQQKTIERVIKAEEESFLQTLENGLQRFEDIKIRLSEKGDKKISGEETFQLYDTFGFPYDLSELLARENGLIVKKDEFDKQMQIQKDRSRNARKVKSQEVELVKVDADSKFIGYDTTEAEAKVLFVDDNQIVLDQTPFYAESGGQVSDTGEIVLAGEKYIVEEVKKSGNAIIHICDREIENLIGATAFAKVNADRRKDIMRHHSATHLLHEALRLVLGDHVQQQGSLVAPDYLRFDFNHFEKVTDEEIRRIEDIVNKKILESNNVDIRELDIEEAQKDSKIKMFFGDKYGSRVRVITMDSKYSKELCGGTHVNNTSEIGLFKITSESSIAAGIRRIEAITGKYVQHYIYKLQQDINKEKEKENELLDKIKSLEKKLSGQKVSDIKSTLQELVQNADELNGIKIIAAQLDMENMDQLRDSGENLRNIMNSKGIGLLATVVNDKVQMVCAVTDDLTKDYPAGKIVGLAAKELGGGGGGKPHMATAGGKDVSKLPELIKSFKEIVSGFKS
jgi:alanyl-tRNA synthetase